MLSFNLQTHLLILFLSSFQRNLPYTITAEELYAIFGKYGAVFQIRLGEKDKDTKGTAFVIYEDIFDAKNALVSRMLSECDRSMTVLTPCQY